jgi:hypothetical protein
LATWESKDKTAFLQRGVAIQSCQLGACNPINFTILNPEDLKWKNGCKTGKCIYMMTQELLHFKRVTTPLQLSSHQAFHSFYEEMKTEFPISTTTNNLFLAMTIAQSLKVSSCYVCRGLPWEARELEPHKLYNEKRYPQPATRGWLLRTSVFEKNCLAQ